MQTTDKNNINFVVSCITQTFQPLNHANLECLKKAPKSLEIGTSDLEISKIGVK